MELQKICIALLALLVAVMVIVPCVSAEDSYDEKLKKWQDDHTIKVTKTVTEQYSDGVLTVETTFTGRELTKRFGIVAFNQKNQMKMPLEEAKKLNFIEEKVKIRTNEEYRVFTAANDHPLPSKSGYPIWFYWYSEGIYMQTSDPINMIWSGASLSTIKTEFSEKGWWTGMVAEAGYYISDGGNWKYAHGIASDIFRYNGGDHVRLCQLFTGEIVGGAHVDSKDPHHAIAYELAEDSFSTFFQDTDDTMWHVYPDNVYLGNSVTSPYSNGYAAYIGYW
ncbi:MAG TPA: hypothetical protein HA272_01950 [Methanoregula sp.]|nr:hypothetical protein [Methanoregula sp.]